MQPALTGQEVYTKHGKFCGGGHAGGMRGTFTAW